MIESITEVIAIFNSKKEKQVMQEKLLDFLKNTWYSLFNSKKGKTAMQEKLLDFWRIHDIPNNVYNILNKVQGYPYRLTDL